MSQTLAFLVTWSTSVALAALTVAMVIVFVRLLLGPSLADRIVALDTISYLAIGFCAVWAVHTGHDLFLDAAATLALLGFLATIAFSRTLRRQARRQEAQP
jgi:multicomponent Na+:H+ antiporter subunit F